MTRTEVDNLVDLYATSINVSHSPPLSGSTGTTHCSTSNVEVSRAGLGVVGSGGPAGWVKLALGSLSSVKD